MIVVQAAATLLRENQLAGGQECFGDVNGLLKKSARIIPQVEHQRIHAPRVQKVERGLQTFSGVIVETAGHIYVADTRTDHVSIGHRRLRHDVTNNFHGFHLAGVGAGKGHLHMAAAGPTNLVTHFR